ncbi:hypothetical protein [Alcaligenes faecalis]|uniref:hypothetical protein n=1 Tax=Alcaligenes faecalis TaxID=511 RepID=UPI000F0B3848|nr:hypothetical protein [Alcaligenes faecalis]AYR19711.1 hypothetical protein D6I95_04645 [Alcaligenes faecalis]
MQLIQHVNVLEQWVREKVGSVNPYRIRGLTNSGNNMSPTINDGICFLSMLKRQSIEAARIYAFDVAGQLNSRLILNPAHNHLD